MADAAWFQSQKKLWALEVPEPSAAGDVGRHFSKGMIQTVSTHIGHFRGNIMTEIYLLQVNI